jgi:A/G-specific adenine glycosylase
MSAQKKWPDDSAKSLSVDHGQNVVAKLLAWYQREQRLLPWRLSKDPYHIWVSEVMAQQTRIETMLPYYQRFLEAFPTVQALADASLDQVLTLWAGLGYYRRAENMQRTAKILVEQYDGNLPDSYETLKTLPGIGDYMAGAIASIAFDRAHPAVDGNVRRVVARMLGFSAPFQSLVLRKQVTEWVKEVIPAGKAGDFNQALMELGAVVCLPVKPACLKCPTEELCIAKKLQMTEILPVRSGRARPADENITVVMILDHQGGVLMRKRRENLLKDFWEFVLLDGHVETAVLADRLAEIGIPVKDIAHVGTGKHVFSHKIWRMMNYKAVWTGQRVPTDYVFNTIANLNNLAFPSAFREQAEWLHREGLLKD